MSYWYYILIVAISISAFICRKEWKRKNRSRLWLRLLASLVSIVCIVLLSYPKEKERQEYSTRKAFIVTDGFNTGNLIPFLKSDKEASFFSSDYSLIQSLPGQKIKWIPDLADFFTQHANDSIYVFGNGFTNEELTSLNGHSFVYKAAALKPAVSSVHWQRELKTGTPLDVQGKYDNNSGKDVKLNLIAFGEVCDSASVKSGVRGEFSLRTVPRQAGKAVYSLLVLSGKDTLQEEPLPIIVENKPPLNILILSSSPDFEKTFLKNRLAQEGYQITMSTSISKNKTDEQLVNTQKTNAGRLNASYFAQFDVLIADDQSMTQLSRDASDAIRSAIENKGLGLLIKLSDTKNVSSFYSQKLSSFRLKKDKPSFTLIHSSLNDSDPFNLKMDEPLCIRYQNGLQPLLQDEQSNIYAANFIFGQGRIVGTTLNNTYTLALSGNSKAWRSAWTLLLDKAAKKAMVDETWHINPEFSFIDLSSSITVESDRSNSRQSLIDSNKISLQQDVLLPYQWQGTYWPRQGGWQTLVQQDGQIKNWFVYDRQEWKSLKDYAKIKATQQYAADHPATFLPRTEGQNKKVTSDIKLFLVIVFFICCGFLWVEQKMA